MPHILIKLIELCQWDDSAVDDFAELIIKDAAVTMRMLRAANRSMHANFGQKPGLKQSLLALGIETVKSLLIGESVAQVFDGLSNSDNSDLRGFWRHSYTAALAAQKVADMADYSHPEEAYLAGLLHDVGRLSLLSAAPREYSPLLSHVDDAGLCVAEKQTFGITHSEAGSWLIGQFSLDSFLADSVLYHHLPAEKLVDSHPLIRISMLSDLVASHGASEPATEAAKVLFGLDKDALLKICKDTEKQVKETATLLKIDLTGTEQAMAVPYPSKRPSNDGNARDQLIVEVKQLILASESRRSFSGAENELAVLSAVAKSAGLQFGFGHVLFLMKDEDGRRLHGVALQSFKQNGSEFSVDLHKGGLVSESLETRQPVFLDSESSELELVEEQLFRLMDADHLVCLPLLFDKQELGVMLGSVPAYRYAELVDKSNPLRMFASQAVAAITSARARVEELDRVADKYRQTSRWVVHEAGNPLSIIKNYLAVLDSKVSRKEPVQAEIEILGQEIDRVSQILLGLTGAQVDKPREKLGVKEVVGEVVRFLKVTNFVPPAIKLDTQIQNSASEVRVESDTLKQILVNLIKNAVEAIQGKGEIVVSIPGYINRDGRLYCALTVHDNGPGIAPQILAKVFTPVKSTKGGDHAGLGLSIVHGLVKGLGGEIMCRSNDGGTTFELLLPVDIGTEIEEDI